MPEPIPPTDVKPNDGNVSPTPTGGQPVPAGEPVKPAPGALKPGEPSPDDKVVPLPALQEERSKRQALESELAQLRRTVEQQQQSYQQPQQPQPQVNQNEELEKLWEEDPRKAVQVEIMYAMDWRDRIDSSLESQADQLAQKFPDFNNYRSTALNQVRNLPLNQRGSRGILEAAYFMVRGQNADTLIQQREAELLEKYRNGEISAAQLAQPAGSFSTPAPTDEAQLTDEQIAVAGAMGLTPEQYKSAMVTLK